MSEGNLEVSKRWGEWDGDGKEEEDLACVDWDLELNECESGEGMDYPLGGNQMRMNVEELTTDGDYPATPWSGSEFSVDEQLTSADGRSLDGGNDNGWGDNRQKCGVG